MEELGLAVILIMAIIYVIGYMKRTLVNGENKAPCQNCPAVKNLSQNKRNFKRFMSFLLSKKSEKINLTTHGKLKS